MASARVVTLEIPMMPPSVNALYTVVRGRKILSNAGRAYKNELKLALSEQLLDYVPLARDAALSVQYHMFFESLYNKGYPDKAEFRFKKVDTSNRIKVLEDVICEVLCVDDSQVVSMEVHKWQGNSKVFVRIREVDDPSTPPNL